MKTQISTRQIVHNEIEIFLVGEGIGHINDESKSTVKKFGDTDSEAD